VQRVSLQHNNNSTEDPNSILARHRNFLKELEGKKQLEREAAMLSDHLKEQKE
jgi:hypothetical protein